MRQEQQHEGHARAGAEGKLSRTGRLGIAAAVASVLALLGATAAQASTVTVGSVLPPIYTGKEVKQVQTFFNTALPERGANLVSPVGGAIVRWRMQGAKGGPFYLRVLHPNGSGGYMAKGTSGPAALSGAGLQSFTANMPIEAGDLIGIDPTNPTDEIGFAEAAGASFARVFPTPFEGATVPASGSETGEEIELSAEVQPTPTITSISPTSGSVVGGSTVTIVGHDFNSASAVKFGTTPASSFTVDSENQITAVVPPSSTVGTVDVTATTLAGTSPTVKADGFAYAGCVVPKLKGKNLTTSRRKLRRASCKLGKISGRKSEQAKVMKQSPLPGKVLAQGSVVNVMVGLGGRASSR